MIIGCFGKCIMLSKSMNRAPGGVSANVKCEMFHREATVPA